jgi:hypothetical protein
MILLATVSYFLLLSISPWPNDEQETEPTLWVTSERENFQTIYYFGLPTRL